MDKIEANGRTVEEAVQAAAEQLGVGIEQVEYEVVDHGAKGFLGLGGTPAIINAWIGEGRAPAPRPATVIEEEPEMAETEEEAEEAWAEEETEVEPEEAEIEEMEAEEVEVREPEPAPRPEPAAATVAPSAEGDEFESILMKTLSDIVTAMKLDMKPVLRASTEDEVTIDLVGSDGQLLTSRQGQTLDALQYLLGIIASRHVPTRRRVILDADGYRDKHKRMLEQKAQEYADAVKAEGKEAVLEPQPARDRRIIHLALADDPDVYTYSEGVGDDRHVVISPKK